jgi:hypothetical protein
MKVAFNKEALVGFLVNHVEKLLVGVVAVCGLGLAFGGLQAVQSRMLSEEHSPTRIETSAREAENKIDQASRPPIGKLRSGAKRLEEVLEPWSRPEIPRFTGLVGVNRPLFGDVKKRDQPTVYPLEELRVIAGVAPLALRDVGAAMAGGMAVGGPAGVPEMGPGSDPSMIGMPAEQPGVVFPKASLTPYCMLTGLIPMRKQLDEYIDRFATASLRSEQADIPRWTDFMIERAEVLPSGREEWKRIDLKASLDRWRKLAGVQQEALPPDFLLSVDQSPPALRAVPQLGYLSPLPQLAGLPMMGAAANGFSGTSSGVGVWGLEALHPWAEKELGAMLAERADAEKKMREAQAETGLPFAPGQPGMGDPGMGSGFSSSGGFDGSGFGNPLMPDPSMDPSLMDPSMMPGMDMMGEMQSKLPYRLFRFLDFDVIPGKAYRYRVRVSLLNPNYRVPSRHLEKPELANLQKIASEPSGSCPPENQPPVLVPFPTEVFVRTHTKDERREVGLKSSGYEALVLDKEPDSGNYELHSVPVERGSVVTLAKAAITLKQAGKTIKVPKHDVQTGCLIVDVLGEQEEPVVKPGRPVQPEPPVEMLILDQAGQTRLISAADSDVMYDRYRVTLPGALPPPMPNAAGEYSSPSF